MSATRDFRADVIADLKSTRKLLLSQGRPTDDVDTRLAEYGVTFDAPPESKQEPAAGQQTATPVAPATPAAPPAQPEKAAAPAPAPAPAKKAAPAKAAAKPDAATADKGTG